MNPTIYFITAAFLLLLTLAIALALLYALRYGLRGGVLNERQQKSVLLYFGLGIFCWLAFLTLMAFIGFFDNFEDLPPRILVAVLPPLILLLVLLFSKRFGQLLNRIPEHWLIYVQSFRIPMELLLWLGYLGGFIPFQMTFEGLNYDILVGITALMAGYVFFGRGRYRHFEAIIWNISGITLLLNIVLIAVLSVPAPWRVFMNEPANRFIAEAPFIWIPGFIVPFAFAVHLFSLKQLLSKPVRSRRPFLGRRKDKVE
ncbi:MAG: hypothetical protein AAF985_12565 [Bacteroidota bacterium]